MLPEAQLNKTTELVVIRTIRCRSWHSLLSATQAMPDRRWLVWICLCAARQDLHADRRIRQLTSVTSQSGAEVDELVVMVNRITGAGKSAQALSPELTLLANAPSVEPKATGEQGCTCLHPTRSERRFDSAGAARNIATWSDARVRLESQNSTEGDCRDRSIRVQVHPGFRTRKSPWPSTCRGAYR